MFFLFFSENDQLVSEPEGQHLKGKPERDGNSGEISACHAERVLPRVLQVSVTSVPAG